MRVCRKIGKVTLAGTILTMGKSFSRAGPAMSASTGSCSGHHTLFDFAVKDWKGLTDKNYAEMNDLYSKHAEHGFEILAFPCNQFGKQEPGSDAQVQDFVKEKGVKFPVFAKIDVNGKGADPLYVWLKEQRGGYMGGSIKWNFTKFLLNANGEATSRYAPTTSPLSIEGDIEKLLDA